MREWGIKCAAPLAAAWILLAGMAAAWTVAAAGEDPGLLPFLAPWLLLDATPWLAPMAAWWAASNNVRTWLLMGHPPRSVASASLPVAAGFAAAAMACAAIAPAMAVKAWGEPAHRAAVTDGNTLWVAERTNRQWRMIAATSIRLDSPRRAPSPETFEAAASRTEAVPVPTLLASSNTHDRLDGIRTLAKALSPVLLIPLGFAAGAALPKARAVTAALAAAALVAAITNIH